MNVEAVEEIAAALSGDRRKYRFKTWLKRAYVDEGRAVADIADECGVRKETVRRWLDKHKIPRRPIWIELALAWSYIFYPKERYEKIRRGLRHWGRM